MTERAEARLDRTTRVVRIPMWFQRRGGRKRIVARRSRRHVERVSGFRPFEADQSTTPSSGRSTNTRPVSIVTAHPPAIVSNHRSTD
jgi:hypothetical protein